MDDELWAKFQIPIGLAFFFRSGVTGAGRRPLPEPGRARPSVSSTSRPGTSWWRCNPVLAGLESDVEALIVNRTFEPARARDRADRSLLRAGRAPSRRAGRASRAAAPSKTRSAAFFGRAAAAGGIVTRGGAGAGRTRAARAGVQRRLGVGGRGHGGAGAALPPRRDRAAGREVFTIALTAQINVDPARRELRRRDARAPGRPVRRARALGGDDAQLPVGARRRRSCRALRARRVLDAGAVLATTWSSRRRSTSTACPTARCRSASTSPARSSTAATTGRCRSCSSPGRAPPSGGCR